MKSVIVGLDYPFIRNVIISLEQNGIIEISKWFVSEETIKEKVKLNGAVNWREFDKDPIWQTKLESIPDDLYDNLKKNNASYLDHLVRESYYEFRTVPENLGVINIFAKYLYNILVQESVEIIVFSDAPHGAYATILYDIAKFLNIKTLILFPCYMRDKFLYCWDLNDIGLYKQNIHVDKNIIEINDHNKLFNSYQKDVFWAPEDRKFDIKAIINTKIELMNSWKEKYDDIQDYIYRQIIKIFSRASKKHVFEINRKRFNENIIEGEKFVYFPLHLQPEMTTATLGGIYNDQILAIERLRRIIPNDWAIYIKENPLQTYAWRDKYFYQRMTSIPNIRLISSEINTYDLIDKCKFVATITGTAGFEAVSGGKPVLVFGLAWYRCLPGVSIYNDKIGLKDILKPFKVEDVKDSFKTRIEENFVNAVIAKEVFEYANIDILDNQKTVYKFLECLLSN